MLITARYFLHATYYLLLTACNLLLAAYYLLLAGALLEALEKLTRPTADGAMGGEVGDGVVVGVGYAVADGVDAEDEMMYGVAYGTGVEVGDEVGDEAEVKDGVQHEMGDEMGDGMGDEMGYAMGDGMGDGAAGVVMEGEAADETEEGAATAAGVMAGSDAVVGMAVDVTGGEAAVAGGGAEAAAAAAAQLTT